jgi:ATP-dependent exoDNAse (exonuclease V) alpha subunit
MINEKIREKMKASGMLPTEEVTIKGKDGVEREFSKGDRIIVTKNQKTDDLASTKILNAEQGQVTDIQYSKLTGQPKLIKLKMDDGKDVTLDLDKSHNIKHAYATSVHKSQGQTKTNAYYWVSNNMNSLHSAYVACSRHRKNLTMYLSEDMVSSMENKLDGKEPTAQMKKVAQWVAKEEKIALPPETLQSFTQTRAWLNEHWNKVAGESGSSLDRFTSVVEAMSATNYKKTSHDYQVLDGAMKNTYEAIKVQRVEEIRNYKSQAVEPPDVLKAQIAQRQIQELAMKRQKQELHAQKIQAEILAKQQQNKPSGIRL